MTYTIYQFDEIDSTSTHAFRLLRENKKLPFVVWAKTQTSGKGRLGTQWLSPIGNLYLTFALSIQNLNSIELTPIKTAIILAKWIQKNFHLRITIKWPNDLLFAGKKIAGILCELSTKSENSTLFVGIGINITNHPLELPYETTSLNAITPVSLSLEQIGHSLIREWSINWNSLNKQQILNAYYQFHIGNKQLWLNKTSNKPHLLYDGLNQKGHLKGILQDKENTVRELTSTHHPYRWIYQDNTQTSNNTPILIADIGNSQTKIAFFSHFKNNMPDDIHYLNSEYSLEENLSKTTLFLEKISKQYPFQQQKIIYYASVNDNNFSLFKRIFLNLHVSFFKIEKRPIFLNTPYVWKDLGIDRIANMEAYLSQAPISRKNKKKIAIILSIGTATVCDILKANGEHLGGTISPGIQFSLNSLAKQTQLPLINISHQTNNLRTDSRFLGKNTKEALATGILHMSTAYIKDIQEKIRRLYPKADISTIVTGGMSFSIANKINANTAPYLTFQGLKKLVTGGT